MKSLFNILILFSLFSIGCSSDSTTDVACELNVTCTHFGYYEEINDSLERTQVFNACDLESQEAFCAKWDLQSEPISCNCE